MIYYPLLSQSQPAVIHIHKIPTENTGDSASWGAGSQSQIDLLFGDSLYLCFHSHFISMNAQNIPVKQTPQTFTPGTKTAPVCFKAINLIKVVPRHISLLK